MFEEANVKTMQKIANETGLTRCLLKGQLEEEEIKDLARALPAVRAKRTTWQGASQPLAALRKARRRSQASTEEEE